jgi:hypothetical protein
MTQRRLAVTLTTPTDSLATRLDLASPPRPRPPDPVITVTLDGRATGLDLTVPEARHLARELDWAVRQEADLACAVYRLPEDQRPPALHWHVYALHGCEARYERVRGWDNPLTEAQARKLADDLVLADTLARLAVDGDTRDASPTWQRLLDDYGDDLADLVSSDIVCGGWTGAWVLACYEPGHCRYRDVYARLPRVAEPYWTPERDREGGIA